MRFCYTRVKTIANLTGEEIKRSRTVHATVELASLQSIAVYHCYVVVKLVEAEMATGEEVSGFIQGHGL